MSGMTKAVERVCLQFTLVDGTTSATNIAITGITTVDQILYVEERATKAAIATTTDRTSEASITSAGNIQLSTTNTSSNQLFVIWNKRSV